MNKSYYFRYRMLDHKHLGYIDVIYADTVPDAVGKFMEQEKIKEGVLYIFTVIPIPDGVDPDDFVELMIENC